MDMVRWERYAEERFYEAGEYLFQEGDPGDTMMIVKEGLVMITKEVHGGEPLVLGYRREGDTLGEIALLRDRLRSASVVATVPTTTLVLHREDFIRLMRSDAEFQDTLLETLVEVLLEADDTRVNYASSEVELFQQIASFSDESRRMESLMRLRQETINFIIHDLRNPINTTILALSMVEMAGDPETQRFVRMANSSLDKMQRLVDSLLDVERLSTGEDVLALAQTDVHALLADVARRFEATSELTGTEYIVEIDGELPVMVIDGPRIERVISNLSDNAFKFTPPESTITLRAFPFTAEDGTGWLRVELNDEGAGIPEDERERIFARFSQTEKGRAAKGFGLGLAFCRSAVVAHGGEIWAEEGDGGTGSKFVFTLPVEPH